MLVRLRVGVDADDLGGPGARQHVGAVALAARHVDDAQPAHLCGDPLVDDEVAGEPVVLLGHVGQRALAGQRQRRDAGRLVALQVRLVLLLRRVVGEVGHGAAG